MRYFNIFLVILWLLAACKDSKTESQPARQASSEPIFTTSGAPVSEGVVRKQGDMAVVYAGLRPGDTVQTRFEGEVISVCQMKGCWMRLSLPEDKTVMVRFKDYGFFVPKDIAGKKVVVEGKAFVSEVSEEERKHLAEDAGQEDSLKTSISGPEIEMGLEATGVRIFN